MISISTACREALDAGAPTYEEIVVNFADGTSMTLDDEIMQGENTFVDGSSADSFPVGKAISRYMTVTLDNSQDQFADKYFDGATLTAYLKVQLTSSTQERILKGTYYVMDPEDYGETIEITAVDAMHKADTAYSCSLTLPQTLYTLVTDACTQTGITKGFNSMTNGSLSITAVPEDMTFRDFFACAAMAACANARIDNSNTLQFVAWNFSGTYHDLSDYTDNPKLSADDVVITGINVTTGDEEDSESYLYGESGYTLDLTNPLLTGHCQTVATTIGAVLVAQPFRTLEGSLTKGDPTVEFGDIAYSYDRKETQHVTPITDVTYNLFGYTDVKTTAVSPIRGSSRFLSDNVKALLALRQKVNSINTVEDSKNYYLASTLSSGVTRSTAGWTEAVQNASSSKPYLWKYDQIDYSDGTHSYSDPMIVGVWTQGSSGRGISSITEHYALSTSSSSVTGTWSTSVQTMTQTKRFLWNYETITYSDGTTATTDQRVIGVYGQKGTDATNRYTWIKYADDASGTGMSDNPSGKEYMGIAYNKTSSTESTTASDYAWSLIKGSDGGDGRGILSMTYKYARTQTQTAPAASAITSSSLPTLNATYKYGWQKETIEYSNGTTQVEILLIAAYGDTGDDGNGIASMDYYYARSTSSTAPSASSITSTTMPELTATYKYLWQKEVISYTNGGSKTTVFLLAVYGDKGDTGTSVSSVTSSKSGTTTTVTVTLSDGSAPKTFTVEDGATGSAGKDAYTVILTNESHTFAGGTSAAISGGSTTTQVVAYKGATAVTPTIGTITGAPTGMTPKVSGTTITITVTDSMTTAAGVLTIPVTVDGKTFNKKFSYSLALTGAKGETGDSATAYSMQVSTAAVKKSQAGAFTPTSITLTGKSQTGTAAMADYAGRFKIETTTNMSSWTAVYTTTNKDESTYTYTVSGSTVVAIRCSLYLAGGTSTLLDQQIVPIVSDGAAGESSEWYFGTDLSHTSGTATLATSVTDGVIVGGMYLNSETYSVYKCTAINSAGTTATWTYAGNLVDGVIDNVTIGQGFTILWNRSAYSTLNWGEAYTCAYDPQTGETSNSAGWVMWNGVQRTVPNQMINPNTVLPYNRPIYIVLRLSSASSTTGTIYMVYCDLSTISWYYATTPTPSAIGGGWTWTDSTDIILGVFTEPGEEASFVETQIFNPVRSSKSLEVRSATTYAAEAQTKANSAYSLASTNQSTLSTLNTQQGVFNKLTNNSQNQGLFLKNGTVYINFTYARGGTLVLGGTKGNEENEYGIFQLVKTVNNADVPVILMDADGLKLYADDGETTVGALGNTGFYLAGSSYWKYDYEVDASTLYGTCELQYGLQSVTDYDGYSRTLPALSLSHTRSGTKSATCDFHIVNTGVNTYLKSDKRLGIYCDPGTSGNSTYHSDCDLQANGTAYITTSQSNSSSNIYTSSGISVSSENDEAPTISLGVSCRNMSTYTVTGSNDINVGLTNTTFSKNIRLSTNDTNILATDTGGNTTELIGLSSSNNIHVGGTTSTHTNTNIYAGTGGNVNLFGDTVNINVGKGKSKVAFKYSASASYKAILTTASISSSDKTLSLPNKTGTLATSSSDVRIKENIKDSNVNALDLINRIQCREFDFLEEYHGGAPHWKCGIIADELEELDNELTEGGGYFEDGSMNVKSIDTLYLEGYIVKALQELSEENRKLKQRISQLEEAVNDGR